MKTYKITHLGLAFMALVAVTAALLAVLIWQRQDAIDLTLKARESRAAEEEIREALVSLERQTLQLGKELAEWDETRQQLVYPGYYTVWRDVRLRDTARLPGSVDGIGLYDKNGRILLPDTGPDPMPEQVATNPAARFSLSSVAGHAHTLLIVPVHADPRGVILLGYLGIKTDLFLAMRDLRQFRFADIDSLSIDQADMAISQYTSLARHIRYELRSNPYIDLFRDIVKESLGQLLVFIGLIVAGAIFLLHRAIVRPLQAFAREIDAMQHDNPSDTPPSAAALPIEELENVRHAFRKHHARLTELHADLERIAGEYRHQAVHDALTGVYNRRAFDSDRQEIERQSPRRCAMLLFDCDRFKEINDQHGHDAGDAVLRAVADCLQRALRAGDRLYRLGGDEFAALLTDTDRAAALAAANRCRLLVLAHDFDALGIAEPVSLSVGIALDETGSAAMEALQKQADTALYAAKQPGADKICVHEAPTGA